jgi:uncharacterized membrane protein YbhN (UPF0104 family)
VRAISLGDREGVSRSAVFGSILVERLMDVAALAVAVLIGVWVIGSSPLLLFAAATGLAIGLVGLGLLAVVGGHGQQSRWLDRFPAGRLRSAAHGLHNGVSVVRRKGIVAQSFGFTVLAWIVTAVAFKAAAAAIGQDLTIDKAFLFAAAVNLATAIPAGPGYIGTFELAAVTVSVALGIPPVVGLATGLIVHLATLVLTTVGGITALAVLHVAPNVLVQRPRESAEALALASESDRATRRTEGL